MDIQQELFTVLDALNGAAIDYALCNGFAVALHGYPRLTKDIDVLIQERDLENVRSVLAGVGYSIDGGEIRFGIGTPAERCVWRVSKVDGPNLATVDLLLVNPFLQDVWRDRAQHRVATRVVAVVSRAGLAKMKRAAGRPRDLEDLRQLGLAANQNDGS